MIAITIASERRDEHEEDVRLGKPVRGLTREHGRVRGADVNSVSAAWRSKQDGAPRARGRKAHERGTARRRDERADARRARRARAAARARRSSRGKSPSLTPFVSACLAREGAQGRREGDLQSRLGNCQDGYVQFT